MIPKVVPTVAQINGAKCLIKLNKLNFSHFIPKISFAVIAHNTEQQCGFGFALPPEESHITPGGDNLPPVWEPLI